MTIRKIARVQLSANFQHLIGQPPLKLHVKFIVLIYCLSAMGTVSTAVLSTCSTAGDKIDCHDMTRRKRSIRKSSDKLVWTPELYQNIGLGTNAQTVTCVLRRILNSF